MIMKLLSVKLFVIALITAHLTLTSTGALAAGTDLIVAFGASQTFGKGVERGQDYPAQLQAMLTASRIKAKVINAGISGDTTEAMLNRLDKDVPAGTKLVIFQPGGNDFRCKRKLCAQNIDETAAIEAALAARKISVIKIENRVFGDYPRQVDGQHLTPEGYHALAQWLLPQVESALRH